MIRVGLVGASGRTGKWVVEALRDRDGAVLHAAVVSPQSSLLGAVVPGTETCYSSSLESLTGSDVVIEFSNPEVSVTVATWCAEHAVPVLIATTGHSAQQLAKIRDCAARVAVGLTPNTSVGAAALISLAESAKKLLGDSFDIELLDLHHRMKKDAPSGTARAILEPLRLGREVVFGREGLRRPEEIGVVALRGGDVAGEHTVFFLGDGERIEISHRVSSRAVFGSGAVSLARALKAKSAGAYSAQELLSC